MNCSCRPCVSAVDRKMIAFAVLGVTFLSGAFLMPWWFFAVCLSSIVLLTCCLLTIKNWPPTLKRILRRRVQLPRWLPVGSISTVGCILLVSKIYPLSVENVVWLALLCGGCVALVGKLLEGWISGAFSCPTWLLIALITAGIVSIVAFTYIHWITFLFLVVFIHFATDIWIVLPLALYQYRQGKQTTATAPYPSVSVLIPAYNEEGYVGDCIESVLASSYPDEKLEVIVIDDGSDDSTYAEAVSYRDRGVQIFHRQNGGKYAAINMGLLCSASEIVVTVDADSRLSVDAIHKIVGQFQEEPNVGGVGGTVKVGNDNGLLAKVQALEYAFNINTNRRVYSLCGAVPVLPGCLAAFRREALDDIDGYDPDTITEDFDVTIKLLKEGWKTRHSGAIVETNVPATWHELWAQRLRWYRGGAETLWKHRDVFTDPAHGYLHAFVLPSRIVSQLFVPPASVLILGVVCLGLLFGPTGYVLLLCAFFLLLTVLLVWNTLLLEDDDIRLLVFSPFLFIGYKHFIDYTVAAGTIQSISDREHKW